MNYSDIIIGHLQLTVIINFNLNIFKSSHMKLTATQVIFIQLTDNTTIANVQ